MKQPNILFIMADDLGHWSLGCEGNADAITPHIDRLATEGMRLRRFYCASPVCSPARASLLTGLMPSAHGVADWIRRGNVDAGGDAAMDYLQGLTGYTLHLEQAGYTCGLSGKWHLGDSIRPRQGFSHWYAHTAGGGPYYGAPMVRDGQCTREPGYLTDAITDDAIQFIQEQAGSGRPFYLQVGYTAPHTPWTGGNHPQEYLDLYKDCSFSSCPIENRHPDQLSYPMFEEDRHAMLSGYFAAVTTMDAGIGRILDTLTQLGIQEDTCVVFTSDNGFNCGHHGIWGKGNGTFPLNVYESSVRVPFIVRWPARVPPGRVDDSLIGAYDWFATVLNLAGINSAPTPNISRDFTGILTGQPDPRRQEAFVFDEYGATRMMIAGDYKFIKRYHDGSRLLFNLTEDPGETRNLMATAPQALTASLEARMEAWFDAASTERADARFASVMGFGQMAPPGPTGYPQGAFVQGQ